MKVLLACDRTGGHVYPAEILADNCLNKDIVFVFCGVNSNDAKRLKDKGYRVAGFIFDKRSAVFEVILRFFEAVNILLCVRPDRVICFGGRSGLLVSLLSSFIVPTAVYEPNAVYGRSNRLLSVFVRTVFLGIGGGTGKKEIKVGVPLRKNIIEIEHGSNKGMSNVLVFGGSSGSVRINETVLEMCRQTDFVRRFNLTHIAGTREYDRIRTLYGQMRIDVNLMPYCENMAAEYEKADIIVGRAGASTIAELDYLRRPAVLIPYPYAYGHQTANARILAHKRRNVRIILQEELNVHSLYKAVSDVSTEKDISAGNTADRTWVGPDEFSAEIMNWIL